MEILSASPKAMLSTVKLETPDIDDGQIWVQSTCAETHGLQRGLKDQFSFAATDVVIIRNRGGHSATLILEAIAAAEDGIFVASNRRGSFYLRESERRTVLMRPDETLIVRSAHALEPVRDSEGRQVRIRNGHTVIAEDQVSD